MWTLYFSQNPLGGFFSADHENAPLPVDHLVRPESSFPDSGLPCIKLYHLFFSHRHNQCASNSFPVVQQNLYFLLLCFAPCVCMLHRDYCFHIYREQQGCKLVLVTNEDDQLQFRIQICTVTKICIHETKISNYFPHIQKQCAGYVICSEELFLTF